MLNFRCWLMMIRSLLSASFWTIELTNLRYESTKFELRPYSFCLPLGKNLVDKNMFLWLWVFFDRFRILFLICQNGHGLKPWHMRWHHHCPAWLYQFLDPSHLLEYIYIYISEYTHPPTLYWIYLYAHKYMHICIFLSGYIHSPTLC